MKKLMWMLSIAMLAVSFAACGDDDKKDESTVDLASKVAGEHSVLVSLTDLGIVNLPAEVVISKVTNTTVNLELKGFNFGEINIPISLENVTLKQDMNSVLMSSTEQTIVIEALDGLEAKVEILENSRVLYGALDLKIKVTADVVGLQEGAIVVVMSAPNI